VKGPENAVLTIIEYSDYTCPYCAKLAHGLKQLIADYPNDVRLVHRNFPVGHDKSNIAMQAAEAAGLQGKYWEMHNVLFDLNTWETWAQMSPGDFINWVIQKAGEIGLDVQQFSTDLQSPAIVQKATDAQNAAQAANLSGTPSLFVLLDNKLYWTPADGFPSSYANFAALIKLWNLQSRQFKTCPAMVIDSKKDYYATLTTTKGDIEIHLFADKAPLTVNSFVFLANSGWYDNVPWHRVIDGFVAQTGDPTGTGMGGPGYEFKDELDNNLNFDQAGMVGMANSGTNTNGSQFFITLAPQTSLDGKYTVFGQVTKGMEVVNQLTRRDPSSGSTLPDPDLILSVTIETR